MSIRERQVQPIRQITSEARIRINSFSRFLESENSRILFFMKIIMAVNQKGGSGKSTLAVHLATAEQGVTNA